jgi:flagellar motor switch protein FliM
VAELADLLGTEVNVHLAPLEHCPEGGLGAALSDPVAAVVLEHVSGSLHARAAIELDPGTAAVVCDRALGGDGTDAAVPTEPLTDAERGALAYVAARVAAAARLPFVVRTIATSSGTLAGALGDDGAAVLPARVRLGELDGLARMWLPESTLTAALFAERTPSMSAALSRVPLTVTVEAAWGTIEEPELRALQPGDALLLDESWLGPAEGGFTGDVRGRITGANRLSMRCALTPTEIRINELSAGVSPGAKEGSKMEPETKTDATSRASDAPLEVSIEIARFTLPLSEVASLAEGEVLATGRAIGERVTLRANGQAIATGELVDVEGEVGMRILSLAD